jgi:hypothetical protein
MRIPDKVAQMLHSRSEEIASRGARVRARVAGVKVRLSADLSARDKAGIAGLTALSTGLAWGATNLTRGRRGWRALLGPAVLLGAGLAFFGRSRLAERARHIDEVEELVTEQLDELDPLGRIKVLKDVSARAVPHLPRHAHAN